MEKYTVFYDYKNKYKEDFEGEVTVNAETPEDALEKAKEILKDIDVYAMFVTKKGGF